LGFIRGLAWCLSSSLNADHCVDAPDSAIVNTAQDSQLAGLVFIHPHQAYHMAGAEWRAV